MGVNRGRVGCADIDCYAGIAGADTFPPEMLRQVVASNKRVHSIDLEGTVRRFVQRFG